MKKRPSSGGRFLRRRFAGLVFAVVAAVFLAGPGARRRTAPEGVPPAAFQGVRAPATENRGAAGREVPSADPFLDPSIPAFRSWAERYAEETSPEGRTALEAEGVRLAQDRRPALARLIGGDPERALKAALPRRLARGIPAPVAARIEEFVSGRGDLEIIAFSPGPAARERGGARPVERFVRIGGRRYRASVYGRRLLQPTLLDIPLHGIALDGAMAVHESPVRRIEPGEPAGGPMPEGNPGGACPVSGRPASSAHAVDVGGTEVRLCHDGHAAALESRLIAEEDGGAGTGAAALASVSWTTGAKTVRYMRVDFSDLPGEPIPEADALARVNVDVNGYYQEVSFGKVSLWGIVTPVLRMPQTAAWYRANNATSQILSDARTAAASAGFSSGSLDVVCFKDLGFPWSGMGYVGQSGTWLNGATGWRTLAHELGHNFGVWHANFLKANGDDPLRGSHIEYGNPFDVMGSGDFSRSHLNAWYKSWLNWVTPAEIQTVTASGAYRVYALESPIAAGSHALKIAKDAYNFYWVEFRQNDPSNAWLMNGASVNLNYQAMVSLGSRLLDMNPATPGDTLWEGRLDSPLVIGRTFSDPAASVHITPVGKGGTSPESLHVVVNIGSFPGNNAPVVAVSASAASASPGTAVTFTAAASDPDGDPLAYAWDLGDGTFGPNAPTATKSWPVSGEYAVQCRVSDMRGKTASDSVLIRVGAPSGHRVAGVVTVGETQPIEGARVTDGTRSAWTDSDGTYTLTNVPAGSFTLAAFKPGILLYPAGFQNPVTVGPDSSGINFSSQSGPDLFIDLCSASIVGRSVSVSDTTRNRGSRGAGGFYVRYYLSTDSAIQTTDLYLGQRAVSSLAPGGVSSGSLTITVPSTLRPGTYRVGAYADGTKAVAESDETNNGLAAGLPPVAFRPDLLLSLLSASIASGKVAVANTFQNQGTASTSGTFHGSFHLSSDAALDAGDRLLGTRARTTALRAGYSSAATTYFAAPAGTAPGDYYVVGAVDSNETQGELDEGNNGRATAARISLRPDLTVSSISATRTGATLAVTDYVKNLGTLPTSGAFRIDYYLSADSTITAFDVPLGSRTVTASLVYAGVSSTTTSLAIPQTLPPGSWRVGAIADGGGAVPELSETNNTKASAALTLRPDLVAVAIAASASGRTVMVTETIRNDGALPARAPFVVDLRLSTDGLIGTTDPLLASRAVSADLAPGAFSTATTTADAPSTVPAGNRYAGMWADGGLAVTEISESNNKKAAVGTIAVGP